MAPILTYLLLMLPLHAGTVPAPAKATCGERELATPTDLPSPLSIDPEDDQAILAFIDRVTPLPANARTASLEEVLITFWSRYRPELTPEQITQRIKPHRPSGRGLVNLRSGVDATRRPEAGRLRLTWMAFIADAVPGAPPANPEARHRAEVLALNQKAHHVIEYLNQQSDTRVSLEDESAAVAMRNLYEAHLPLHQVPNITLTPIGRNNWHRGLALVAYWRAYVEALNAVLPITARPPAPQMVYTQNVDGRADPSTVPDHPRARIEYLSQRYPDVRIHEPEAIWKFVRALRDEWDLGPSRIDVSPGAAAMVLRRDKGQLAREQLRSIWEEFLKDRRASTRAMRSSRHEEAS